MVLCLGVQTEMLMLSFRIDSILLVSFLLVTLSLVGKKHEEYVVSWQDIFGVWDLSTPEAIVLDGKGNGQ